ncbi:MAG: hypothetical protein ACREO4_06375 [Lysobacter sp.]
MKQLPIVEQQHENRALLACLVLAAIGVALRVTELAGLWSAP